MKAASWGGKRWGKTAAAAAAGLPVAPKRRAGVRPDPKPIDDIDDLPAGVRIVCPWPPAELSPNARVHWSRKNRAARNYRRTCWALALAAGAKATGTGSIVLQLDFFPPDRRARDDDNAIAGFKSGRDGIADALKVDDSRFVTSQRWRREARACVVVTLIDRTAGSAAA